MTVVRRAAPLLLAVAAPCAMLVACFGPRFAEYAERPRAHDALDEIELGALARARRLAGEGELEAARKVAATLCASSPRNLFALRMLQDLELALLESGEAVEDVGVSPAGVGARGALYARETWRAEAQRTAEAFVLAGRLAPDAASADAWLALALEADPGCVWAHYGRAWNHARARRFEDAWEALTRALRLDPGHPPSRFLEAALLTRSGDVERAIDAWRAWIARYGSDPRTAPGEDAGAHLDLALLLVQAGRPAEALSVLDSIDSGLLADPLSTATARVAALDGLGRADAALAEARRAAALAPDDDLSRRQIATLLSDRFGDAEGAREAWEDVLRVLEASAAPAGGGLEDVAAAELSGLFLKLQARAALAALASGTPGATDE